MGTLGGFNYIGITFLGCDPSSAQKSALGADSTFRQTLTGSYGTEFGDSSTLFNQLNSGLEQITSKGPEQEGMSAQEKAAENSQALNSAAASNKNVQALIGQKASMSGATPGVESGVTTSVRANAAANIENNLSNKQADITEKDYAIGRENYSNAVKEQEALPSAAFGAANQSAGQVEGAEEVENKQANENESQSSSWMGLVGGLASSAIGAAGTAAGCITPDTLILKANTDHPVPAYDIQPGDILVGIQGPEEVIRIVQSQQPCVRITLENGMQIDVSTSHTFVLAKGGYTESWEAKGKELRTYEGSSVVEKVDLLPTQMVINIILAGAHNYVSNGFWSEG